MQQFGRPAPPQTKRRKSGRGKLLLFVLVAAGLVFGTVHIVHGSSVKSTSHRRAHWKAHTVCTVHRTPAGKKLASCRRVVVRQRIAHHALTPAQRHQVALRKYARGLVPALARARSTFDRTATAMAANGLDAVGNVCNGYGLQLSVLSAVADGVPHPGAWYLPVSRLHYHLMDIFHRMQGATQDCQTASENSDSEAAATALADAQQADSDMRALDDYVVRVGRRR